MYFGSRNSLLEDFSDISEWNDSASRALCIHTANILVLSLPSNRTLLLPAFLLLHDLSITFNLSHSFSIFQLSYSHLLIFTSSCLPLSLTFCCLPTPSQHISISPSSITSSAMFSFNHPLKKYIHLRTTGLLLDHILCCYSCYHGQFLCSRGGQELPCTQQSTSGNVHTKERKMHSAERLPYIDSKVEVNVAP